MCIKQRCAVMCVFVVLCGAFAACSGGDEGTGGSSLSSISSGESASNSSTSTSGGDGSSSLSAGNNGSTSNSNASISGTSNSNSSLSVGSNSSSSESTAPEIEGMAWVRPGTFTMGSPAGEVNRDGDETQHEVTLTKGFYMGKYQVTQELYQLVMATNPSSFTTPAESETSTLKRPVERVSWYETLVFCNTLSMLEDRTPVYKINGSTNPASWGAVPTSNDETWNAVEMVSGADGYRLPTEAEWEYACRAGTTTEFNWEGDTINDSQANYDASYEDSYNTVAGTSLSRTTGVGSYTANAWGLYDMHGNVWEWCWDWYAADYGWTTGTATDPEGVESGSTRRVTRGRSRKPLRWDPAHHSSHTSHTNPSTIQTYSHACHITPTH
jgi:formylglycine-generating enzyme required for sulfatase activity